MKKLHSGLVLMVLLFAVCLVSASCAKKATPIPIKVLLLPKFEVDEMAGDFPGEAQFYYEKYLAGGEEYTVKGGYEDHKLYVKDGVALYLPGMGKANAALSTMAVLSDSRFDFSNAYVISTGCAGSSRDTTVMGDVFVITGAVDYDLGHHADIRELKDGSSATWFHDSSYDDVSSLQLDPALMDKVYELVKDVPVKTTDRTRAYMLASFDGAAWAGRDPRVLRGTTVTGDNYWKGEYDHQNALLMTKTYGCTDPYAVTEMEDLALGQAIKRMGMLNRYIILRVSVNMDVFMYGASPESLWDPAYEEETSLASEDNVEAADIFATAMENNFNVGSVVIDAILNGTL